MSTEKQVYEIDGIWSTEWFTPNDAIRIEELTNIVLPLNIDSLVDVGCGNGLFLNHISSLYPDRFRRLCGVERSLSAINNVKTEKIVASIDAIPLQTNEFDLVSCQEVIEHLPNTVFTRSIKELGRISKKYILISVPYNENLKRSLVQCPKCTTEFNPEYHMRSFNKKHMYTLQELLKAKLINKGFITVKTFAFPRLLATLSGLSNKFPTHTICPMCGYNENSKLSQRKIAAKTSPIKSFIKFLWPEIVRKRWIYALYQK